MLDNFVLLIVTQDCTLLIDAESKYNHWKEICKEDKEKDHTPEIE